MRCWIFDEDNTPQGFPLEKLFRSILNQFINDEYKLWVFRSQGYGLKINQWDDRLDKEDKLAIHIDELLGLGKDSGEWFYDLDVEMVTSNGEKLKFGLHDSTAMYIEASEKVTKDIVASFTHVKAKLAPMGNQ